MISILTLSACSVFGIRGGYETLNYKVVDNVGKVEIREYPARLAAEVSGAKTKNDAFRSLFKYISGANTLKSDISMTTPVQVNVGSDKISMTTPVESLPTENQGVKMRFFLPASLSIENAPKPLDPRIAIIQIPLETLAVLTYSGFSSDTRFKKASSELESFLEKSDWKPQSSATFLGYDPPFTLPFLRRNEVTVRVKKTE